MIFLRVVSVVGPLRPAGCDRTGPGTVPGFPGIRFALARAALAAGRRLGERRSLDDVIRRCRNLDDVIVDRRRWRSVELEHVVAGGVGRRTEHERVDVLENLMLVEVPSVSFIPQ